MRSCVPGKTNHHTHTPSSRRSSSTSLNQQLPLTKQQASHTTRYEGHLLGGGGACEKHLSAFKTSPVEDKGTIPLLLCQAVMPKALTTWGHTATEALCWAPSKGRVWILSEVGWAAATAANRPSLQVSC